MLSAGLIAAIDDKSLGHARDRQNGSSCCRIDKKQLIIETDPLYVQFKSQRQLFQLGAGTGAVFSFSGFFDTFKGRYNPQNALRCVLAVSPLAQVMADWCCCGSREEICLTPEVRPLPAD